MSLYIGQKNITFGQKGATGKSAYAYAQDGGYAGTKEEFAEKLAKDVPDVVDTTGESLKDVMSQYAVTEALKNKMPYGGSRVNGTFMLESYPESGDINPRVVLALVDGSSVILRAHDASGAIVGAVNLGMSGVFITGLEDPIFDGSAVNLKYLKSYAQELPPAYVEAAAKEVIKKVARASSNRCLRFIAISDMHVLLTNTDIMEGNKHAGQAAKLIREGIGLDFCANLGDISWGASNVSTIDDSLNETLQANQWLAEAFKGVQHFRVSGNHDPLTYNYELNNGYLTPAMLHGLISNYNEGAVIPNGYGGWCYKDFEEKKLRVICLNTADMSGLDITENTEPLRISGEQLKWFAETLDLSAKEDASEWGIIFLSHHPMDWGSDAFAVANCMQAYLEGKKYEVTRHGVKVSYDYAGKNQAKIIAQFHGHVHNFKVDNIRYLKDGVVTPTNIKRIAIPNACFSRSNECGRNGITEVGDVEYGESETYNKTAGTANDTAFCVVSIDLDEEVVHAFCYGAGYDREIYYGAASRTYSITNSLTNAVSSNAATEITGGMSYVAEITADKGCVLSELKVTMGGTDVTNDFVDGGKIGIPSVTGNIVITAKAVASTQGYTNQIPISKDTDGSVYNAVGYMENMYLSEGEPKARYSIDCSGFIPIGAGSSHTASGEWVIRMSGITATQATAFRFAFYDANKTFITQFYGTNIPNSNWGGSGSGDGSVQIPYELDASGNVAMFDITKITGYIAHETNSGVPAFMRICSPNIDGNSILTVNEEIV